MRKLHKYLHFLFFILFSISLHSQVIEGRILDSKTQESLPGATVYLDGTTISTITDENGNFNINTRSSNATLVVSFIGYTTYRLENPLQYVNKKLKVLLVEQSINLDEVVVGKGPFSRKQMMKVFREQFLGESKSGSSCKIENEQDIVLYYDVSNNTLHGSARSPLKIKNSHLEYEVNFDLEEFAVQFNYKSLEKHNLKQSLFSGTTFYKDISKSKKADKRRKEAFYGSAIHFVLTVANNSWQKEDIRLFVEGFPVNPEEYFKVEDTLGFKKIKLIKEPQKAVKKYKKEKGPSGHILISETNEFEMKPSHFNILYKKDKQSVVDFREKVIYVDKNGNYTPIFGILYGGYIGTLKAGDMLPSDYYQTIKEMQKE
ncbi:MAG: carboxypeptidase-like regulatory domain-containing protein [Flavobacterium sp.]|nr:MAG: carboxypeptidase-like regulatory domain-containing protein [Flavobacterium sp.]